MLAEASAALARAGCDEPRRRARRLIAGALDLTAAELLVGAESTLDRSAVERLRGLTRRMAEGEPLSRVLGRRGFWGLDFALSPQTLDPRPESETIIEAVLARLDRSARLKVLDLGTGAGCLLLALLSELPAAIGIGVDLSEGAAATAYRNARSLGLTDRSVFFVGNWGNAIAQRFDIIVTNPPYIATAAIWELPYAVRGYDPQLALDGGADGLDAFRSIASQVSALLAPFGIFITEIGVGQAGDVGTILSAHGMYIETVERDLAGIERCLVARGGQGRPFGTALSGEKNLGMHRRRD
jgi:release factor glutamine methyltransferase